MSIENPTLSAAADLAHFRHYRHFRHLIRRGGFSSLFTNVCSTTVEIALQISSILTNKPKVKYAKINVSSYFARGYVHAGHLVIQTNKANSNPIKAKTNPIQTQLSKGQKMMQSVYLQRIMKKYAAMDYEKQSQNKPNLSRHSPERSRFKACPERNRMGKFQTGRPLMLRRKYK